jgi:hypothetical protein
MQSSSQNGVSVLNRHTVSIYIRQRQGVRRGVTQAHQAQADRGGKMANDRVKSMSIDDSIAGFPPEVHTSSSRHWENAAKFFL